MKEIQIRWNQCNSPLSSGPYYTPNPAFAWFGQKERDAYHAVTGWHGCRETFVGEYKRKFGVSGYTKGYEKMTTRYLRVLVKFKSEKQRGQTGFRSRVRVTNRWMKESVRMLNIIEKYLGWSLTKLYRVKDKMLGGKKISNECVVVYALTGSSKWLRAPQLMSLYLLFVRLGRFGESTRVFKSMDDLNALYKSIKDSRSDGQGSQDRDYFYKIKGKLKLALDNRKKLFFTRPMAKLYTANNGWHGINNLLAKKDADQNTKKRWNEILASTKKG